MKSFVRLTFLLIICALVWPGCAARPGDPGMFTANATVLREALEQIPDAGTEKIVPLEFPRGRFLALGYRDIPRQVHGDPYGVDLTSFVRQLEFLKNHGCHFVSLDDILNARQGRTPLPRNPVLLTFDYACRSFYDHVFPVLKLYGYPAAVSVVADWVDNPPESKAPDCPYPLMSPEQLQEVARHDLIEIVSHTDSLLDEVRLNPHGDTAPAAVTRIYNPENKTYENESAYQLRLRNDLTASVSGIQKKVGVTPKALIWPHGACNRIAIEEAKKAGFRMTLTLDDGLGSPDELEAIPRHQITNNPSIRDFIDHINDQLSLQTNLRVIHARLDTIYDPDPVRREKNLDRFIERISLISPSTVFLDAFCDEDGDGIADAVYFPSRVMPTRADFFSRAARLLNTRQIEVYASMPMLSVALPDTAGKTHARQSPFDPQACDKITALYEDLAIHCDFDGIVFEDDGYLTSAEDFHPFASLAYQAIAGSANIPFQALMPDQKTRWAAVKTDRLTALSKRIMENVRYHRSPGTRFACVLDVSLLLKPAGLEWLAGNYEKSLEIYDYVVITAGADKVGRLWADKWLASLVNTARGYPGGLEKTVFTIRTGDEINNHWTASETIHQRLRILLASGARHVGYSPDNYIDNLPDSEIIREIIGTKEFPF